MSNSETLRRGGERIKIQRRKQIADTYSYPQLGTDTNALRMGIAQGSVSHEISRISLRPQAKLSISQPGDAYEQEADRVAQQVMSMGDRTNNTVQREASPQEEEENLQLKSLGNTITPLVQREEIPEEEEEEEENLQMKSLGNLAIQREEIPEEEEEEELVQAKSSLQRDDDGGLAASSDISSKLHNRKGEGSPLSKDVQNFMEPRFGVNFSHVKVHTDGEAVQMSRELGAQAFTYGSDVYFGSGKSPGNNELTAHELTHVVQQEGSVPIQQKKLIQGNWLTDTASAVGNFIDNTASSVGNAVGAFLPSSSPPGRPPAPVAKLKLHADTETNNRSDLSFKELQSAQVGHSWVSLEYTDRTKIPNSIGEPTQGLLKSGSTAFGFWPLITRASSFTTEEQERIDHGQTPGAGASNNVEHTGFSLAPWKNVPGRVEEPDTAHTPKGTKEYDLTQAEVGSLLSYVNSKRSANYNLYTFNCTTFAVESVRSAGQVAPGGSSWGICLPNALYKDLYQMKKKGDKSVKVAPLEPDERHE